MPAPSGVAARLRSRPGVIVTVLLGGGLVLLAGGRGWVSRAVTGVPGVTRVSADGTQVAPAATALALVALAGAVALALTGRLGRRLVAGLLVLAGLGVVAFVAAVVTDPVGALAPSVMTATGQSGPVPGGGAGMSGWPWVAVAGAVLIGLGGLAALVSAASWGSGGRRFEAGSATARPGTGAGSGDGATARTGTGAGTGAGPGARPAGDGAARRDRDLETWDALSRGEDPTGS
jgi:uncharacterized membrane protein (TIGR02234 family)